MRGVTHRWIIADIDEITMGDEFLDLVFRIRALPDLVLAFDHGKNTMLRIIADSRFLRLNLDTKVIQGN